MSLQNLCRSGEQEKSSVRNDSASYSVEKQRGEIPTVMDSPKENANPRVFRAVSERQRSANDFDESTVDEIDEREVFDTLRRVSDPEHPLSLEELNVVSLEHIRVHRQSKQVEVEFTPTIPHCSLATLIGLCLRVQLGRCLPLGWKSHVSIRAGTHVQELQINKQLADKERVAAAIENPHLANVVNECLRGTYVTHRTTEAQRAF